MNFFSTNKKSPLVTLKEAVLQGLPDDNGLFMPEYVPALPASFFEKAHELSFDEIAFQMAGNLIGNEVQPDQLRDLTRDAFNFEVPLVQLDSNIHVLELFHGPTLAFKDFGARFMARLMAQFMPAHNGEINILVATSGDTGSAVAQGFLGVPGIKVTLLYPSGKVSELQEKQLTTIGSNIQALEIHGTFDDCQSMVKEAFLDTELKSNLKLTSANSINIARLLPQSFYFMYAWSRLKMKDSEVVFCVPSGNFGNLSGGLLAKQMGMPVNQFIAATNINKVVPDYLQNGTFQPKRSIQTLANAMDVGNPSNFPRLKALLGGNYDSIKPHLTGYYFDDSSILETISEVHDRFGYFVCPHTAIGYRAVREFLNDSPKLTGITLATAHPAKFMDTVENATQNKVEIPLALKAVMGKQKEAIEMENKFSALKAYLMN